MNSNIIKAIEPVREKLLKHPVYELIRTKSDIQSFTEIHVYAVWDFMSLLKSLQSRLTCIQIPWRPNKAPEIARFINEIVLGEETDVDREGKVRSHFELYLEAMESLEADTTGILNLVESQKTVEDVRAYLGSTQELSSGVKRFLDFSFGLIEEGAEHKIAAAFTFGREDLIPDIFTNILAEISKKDKSVEPLLYYLERHIELDGDEHGPLSLRMMDLLCGDDPTKWQEAEEVAIFSLKMRLVLWDEIYSKLVEQPISL